MTESTNSSNESLNPKGNAARKSANERRDALLAELAQIQAQIHKLDSKIRDQEKTDANRDKLLIGVAALSLADRDPRFARELVSMITAPGGGTGLRPNDVRHLRRPSGTLEALLKRFTPKDATSTEPAEQDPDRQPPSPQDDIPKTGENGQKASDDLAQDQEPTSDEQTGPWYFESVYDRKKELDAAGARFDPKLRIRVADTADVAAHMRTLGIPELSTEQVERMEPPASAKMGGRQHKTKE